MKRMVAHVFSPKPLLVFVGVLALGLIINSFAQLFQASPVDYAAIKWLIFWAFVGVISFAMLWFYVSVMSD